MKKALLSCVIAAIFLIKACQTDDTLAIYQQIEASSDASVSTQVSTYEFSGDFSDESRGIHIVGGRPANRPYQPDLDLEEAFLASEPTYLILGNAEKASIMCFVEKVINNLYVKNYASYDQTKIYEERSDLFSPDIEDLISTNLNSQVVLDEYLDSYKMMMNVSHAIILEDNFVTMFTSIHNDKIYRVEYRLKLFMSTAANHRLFFEHNPQFYAGDTGINNWLYIIVPGDGSEAYRVAAITENIYGNDVVSTSIYDGQAYYQLYQRNTSILEKRAAEYIQEDIMSKEIVFEMKDKARAFQEALYVGDDTTLTANAIRASVNPLCTKKLQDRLADESFFESYAQNISNTNATLSRDLWGSNFEPGSQFEDETYRVQLFSLDDGSCVYLYYDVWLGSVVANDDLDPRFGLERCVLDEGKRLFTTYFFFELVDGKPYISEFVTYETGQGEGTFDHD